MSTLTFSVADFSWLFAPSTWSKNPRPSQLSVREGWKPAPLTPSSQKLACTWHSRAAVTRHPWASSTAGNRVFCSHVAFPFLKATKAWGTQCWVQTGAEDSWEALDLTCSGSYHHPAKRAWNWLKTSATARSSLKCWLKHTAQQGWGSGGHCSSKCRVRKGHLTASQDFTSRLRRSLHCFHAHTKWEGEGF